MGRGAEKLLERMRATKAGWGQNDFARLYEGFGFRCNEGSNHTIYEHPDYPELTASVPRHNELKKWVAREAVKVIEELLSLEEGESS